MSSTTTEQIDKIKALIQTAKNPKQKKDYQKLLDGLNEKLKQENKDKPKVVSVKPPKELKPNAIDAVASQAPPITTEPKKPLKSQPIRTEEQPVEQLESPTTTSNSTQSGNEVEFAMIEKPVPPQVEALKKPDETGEQLEDKPTGKPADPSEDKPTTGEQSDHSSSPKVQSEDSDNKESEEDSDDGLPKPFFQGIGIIKGEVTLTEEKSTVKLNGKEYRLYYVPGRRKKAYEGLKKEIESTGNSAQRLIVYPKILHLPKRDQPHQVAFQLVGYVGSKGSKSPLNEELKDGEFKLSGLWQFIPVCRTPCISIFRNFNQERLAWIKEVEPARKVKFMKSSHIPLLWKDSPIKPFRFNPKLDKEEQGKPKFVQVKVKFLPGRDVFGFVEEMASARDKAPGFLKASKKLKTEAMAAAKEAQKQKLEEKAENTPQTTKPKPAPIQQQKSPQVEETASSEK